MSQAIRRLVLLRHGRTAWNAERRVQGQLDAELDDVGVEQALQVASAIAVLTPVAVVSSDLARASLTAETVAKQAGLVASYDRRLREFALGEMQGRTHEEIRAADPAGFERFRRGDWSGLPGAEAPRAVARRVSAALHDLAATLAPGETGVAVSHGAASRIGLTHFLGWPLEVAQDLRALDNCARVVLEQQESGQWALGAYNLPPDFVSAAAVG